MIELVGQNVKQMEIKDSKGSFEGGLMTKFSNNLLSGNDQLPFHQHKDPDGFWLETSMTEGNGVPTTRKNSFNGYSRS